jgi:predicted transcriptional regulator
MERVSDVLRHKYPQFNTIAPNRSITDALHQMQAENVDHLIVMEDDRFVGVLTEHDITSKIIYQASRLDTATVKDFMSTYLPVATMSDSLEHCMQLMEKYNMRHLAIYERFTFKGVISSHDLINQVLLKRKAVFDELEEQNYLWD